MGMVAREQRIASTYFVICGNYGDVRRYAAQRGVCRQTVYANAARVQEHLADYPALRRRLRELEQAVAQRDQRLAQAVVFDKTKQAEFAVVSQAIGVTLRQIRQQLKFLVQSGVLSIATLGRRTRAAGKKAGAVLAVL